MYFESCWILSVPSCSSGKQGKVENRGLFRLYWHAPALRSSTLPPFVSARNSTPLVPKIFRVFSPPNKIRFLNAFPDAKVGECTRILAGSRLIVVGEKNLLLFLVRRERSPFQSNQKLEFLYSKPPISLLKNIYSLGLKQELNFTFTISQSNHHYLLYVSL